MFPIISSEPNENRVLEEARNFMSDYVGRDEYKKVKMITTLDNDLSMLYAVRLTEEVAKKIKEELEKQGKKVDGVGDRDEAIKKIVDVITDGGGSKQGDQQGSGGDNGDVFGDVMRKVIEKAVKEARKDIEIAKEIKELIDGEGKKKRKGGGVGGRDAGDQPGGFRRLLDLVRAIKEVEGGEKIVSMAKRVDDLAFYVKIRKIRDRFGDELGGYRVTRKVEDAIARELALPDDLFFAKLVSGSLVAKEKLRVSEGAYYVLIDKSGSMAGEKTVWARSVALALYRIARKKKRQYYLRFFDVGVSDLASDPDDVVEAILTIESGGGTSITHALNVALNDLARNKEVRDKTNTVVIITDGEDRVAEYLVERFREVNARLVAVMIYGENETLRKIAEATGGQYMKAELDERGAIKLVDIVRR